VFYAVIPRYAPGSDVPYKMDTYISSASGSLYIGVDNIP